MRSLSTVIVGCAIVALAGCATGGPGVTMDPFTPEEISVLTHAATHTYLMERNVSPEKAKRAVAYIEAARSSVASGTIDLLKLRTELVEHVPAEWQPIASATWVILLKRIHIEQLIADGQYVKARAYIDAALEGALSALLMKV